MDFSQLKEILKHDVTSKFIMFDDGKPTHIIISMGEYKRLLEGDAKSRGEKEAERDSAHGDTMEIRFEETSETGPASTSLGEAGHFRVEDLPF